MRARAAGGDWYLAIAPVAASQDFRGRVFSGWLTEKEKKKKTLHFERGLLDL
jgi:hypothetical protein